MHITICKIAKITEASVNPRRHSEQQIALIGKSIKRFGFTLPVLIDPKGALIAGHARVEAAKQIGMTAVPTVTAKGWTKQQRQAYLLADNRLSEMSEWDNDELKSEIAALRNLGVDIDSLGFDEALLIKMGAIAPLDENATKPAPPKRASTGDTWQLGDNRLLVTQATDTIAIAKAASTVPQLMVTAPQTPDEAQWYGFNGGLAYIWQAGATAGDYAKALARAGFAMRYQLIWPMSKAATGKRYRQAYHFALFATRKGAPLTWRGGRTQSTYWESIYDSDPDIAPVEARRRCITNHIARGEFVFDPDDRKGHTIMAAEIEHRRAVSIIEQPRDADAVIARWEKHTGKRASNGNAKTSKKTKRKATGTNNRR